MIRVFELDGLIANVDNDEDAERFETLGWTEIDAKTFGEFAGWANSENTKLVNGVWVFTPDIDDIKRKTLQDDEGIKQRRLDAYREESFNLFVEWQVEKEFGTQSAEELEKLRKTWLDKILEINERIPL